MKQVPGSRIDKVTTIGHLVEKRASQVAACAWLAVALTTVLDVLGRSIFGSPIYGAFELVKLFMAIGIFLSIPSVVLRHGHVQVHLLSHLLPKAAQQIWTSVGSLIGAGVFAVVSYGLFALSSGYLQSGERTTLLGLPLWTIAVFMALASAAIVVFCLIGIASPNTDESN